LESRKSLREKKKVPLKVGEKSGEGGWDSRGGGQRAVSPKKKKGGNYPIYGKKFGRGSRRGGGGDSGRGGKENRVI